jgi:ligand-binding SRPBCC domain-containing protein
MTVFESAFLIKAPLERVWAFHDDPMSLTKIMGGPVQMKVLSVDRPVRPGSRVRISMEVGPIRIPWTIQIVAHDAPVMFKDQQVAGQGPWKSWVHTHRFEAVDPGQTRVIDTIEYEPPLGFVGRLGNALIGSFVMRQMFAGRVKATRALLER